MCIHELPQEYWRPKLLFEIVGGLSTPISLDESTRNRVLGHFARVLVDIYLTAKLHDEILVERYGFAFLLGIEYEKLPFFCSFCQAIGHSLSNCKKKPGGDGNQVHQDPLVAQKPKQIYVLKVQVQNQEDLK